MPWTRNQFKRLLRKECIRWLKKAEIDDPDFGAFCQLTILLSDRYDDFYVEKCRKEKLKEKLQGWRQFINEYAETYFTDEVACMINRFFQEHGYEPPYKNRAGKHLDSPFTSEDEAETSDDEDEASDANSEYDLVVNVSEDEGSTCKRKLDDFEREEDPGIKVLSDEPVQKKPKNPDPKIVCPFNRADTSFADLLAGYVRA